MRNHTLFTSVLVLSALTSVACGSSNDSSGDDNGTSPPPVVEPGPTVDGGNNTAPDGAVPPGCDVNAVPATNACVVNETLGVFVAPPTDADAGADAATPDGTRGNPFSKMQDAINAAKAQKKRVYACIGSYAEQITLADGVSIFGDLDCNNNWSVVTAHAALKAPASPAASADQIQTATRIESLDLIAPDATTAGDSSIALIANASPGLTLANATVHAGKGANGADGIEGIQLSNAANINGANGVSEYAATASAPLCSSLPATTNTCVGVAGYQGGSGGAGGWGGHWVVEAPSGGFASTAQYQLPQGVACSVLRPCVCSNSPGGDQPASATTAQGAYTAGGAAPGNRVATAGVDGTAGSNGASGAFSFTSQGRPAFVRGDGLPGANGNGGQGGGGGMGIPAQPTGYTNGANVIGSAGASGGAGGCPGLAGTVGQGGGASIAILASDSPLHFIATILESSAGGDGGKGTFGSNPSGGGLPGINYGGSNFTAGMPGGSGGNSGWSGSGSGGPSIQIAFHGAAPDVSGRSGTVGTGGHGVAARTQGSKIIPATTDGPANPTVTF